MFRFCNEYVHFLQHLALRRAISGNGREGLLLVPALEEGASKGAVEDHVHHVGGCRSPINLNVLGLEGENREDVSVLSSARHHIVNILRSTAR